MSIILDGTQGTTTPGLYSTTTFTGTYTDGIVADYTTGLGRISVGAADGIAFYNGGVANTERMRLDASGNLGLGVTPSAWGATLKPLEIGAVGTYISGRPGSNQLDLGVNNYYNAGYKYAVAGQRATQYEQFNGTHSWYYAGVSTNAGDPITFTQAMTLDASGNLGVGITSMSYPLTRNGITLQAKGTDGTEFVMLSSVDSGYTGFAITRTGADAYLSNRTNGNLVFSTNNTERARIDSSGYLLVGTTSTSGSSTNTGFALAGAFYTATGSATPASGVATTVFTVPNSVANGVYIVSANIPGQAPSVYQAVGLISAGTGTLRHTPLATAASLTISVSGANIQVTQNSGASNTFAWTVTRLS